jgi:hypothetical protein
MLEVCDILCAHTSGQRRYQLVNRAVVRALFEYHHGAQEEPTLDGRGLNTLMHLGQHIDGW